MLSLDKGHRVPFSDHTQTAREPTTSTCSASAPFCILKYHSRDQKQYSNSSHQPPTVNVAKMTTSPPPGYVAANQLGRSLSVTSDTPSVTAMTPPASVTSESPDSLSPPKDKKKRKSWGQEIPDIPRTLGPRKRAKTDQERQQRNIERIERNRHSAAKSREKQKAEASELRRENEEQKEYIRQLEERLRHLQGGSAPFAMPSAMPSSLPTLLTPTSEQFSSPDLALKSEADGSDFTEDYTVHGSYLTAPPTHASMSRSASAMSNSTLAPSLSISHADRMLSIYGSRSSATTQVEHQHRSLAGSHNVSLPKVDSLRRSDAKATTTSPSLLDLSSGSQHSAAVFSTYDQQCPLELSGRLARPTDMTNNSLRSILFCFQTMLMALTWKVSTRTISRISAMFSKAERQLIHFSPSALDKITTLMLSLITTPTSTMTPPTASSSRPHSATPSTSVFRGRLLRKLASWSPKSAHLLKVAAGRASRRLVSEGFDPAGSDPSQIAEWASLMTMSWTIHRSLKAIGAVDLESSIRQSKAMHHDSFHHQHQTETEVSSSSSDMDMDMDENPSEHREWLALLQASLGGLAERGPDEKHGAAEWSTESLGELEAELENLRQLTGSPVLRSESNTPHRVF